MKHLTLAVLALGSMTACTRVVEVQAPVPVTEADTAPPETSPPQTAPRRASVADQVHDLFDGPVYVTDYEIEETARITCDALDSGTSLAEISQMAVDAADGDRDTERLFAAITVVAIMELCPQHEWMLEALST